MTKYYISARDNTTLLLTGAGIEKTYEKFSCLKVWNDVGGWVLTLRREDPKSNLFMPDASGNLHAGIIVQVDYEDGHGLQTILTGPQTMIDVAYNEDNTHVVLISGACDNFSLSKRISLPFAGWPYQGNVILNPYAPKRYYTLGESAGPTATDLSTSAQNGTYTGGVTFSQAALIADPPTSVLVNGTTGFVSVPTAALPAVNTAWSVAGWGMVSAYPGVAGTMWSFGTNAASQAMQIGIDSTGHPFFKVRTLATQAAATPVPLNQPFMLLVTWDGTTMKGFLNGVQFASQTPGALNITYGTCVIGEDITGVNFWLGKLGHCAFFAQDMSAQLDPRGVYAWPLWAYRVGLSELAYVDYAYGFSQGTQADVDLWTFVWANLNFPPARQPFGFNAGASPSLGATSSPTYSRVDNLLTLIQTLALKSAPQLGFRLQQSGGNLALSIFKSRDQSATAVFSLARNNIRSYKWHYEIAKFNFLYGGGKQQVSGVPESRIFAERSDGVSIGQFGRLEAFLDDRAAPDQATLQGSMTAALAKNSAMRSFEIKTKETAVPYFLGPGANGYDVGDTVTTVLEGQTFVDWVREVQLDLEPGKLPVVTPVIGTPHFAKVNMPDRRIYTEVEKNADATSSIAINY